MAELFQQLLVEEADEELGWQERALCAQTDPESFFPEKGGSTREAKKVCLACEVRSECLEYALAHDERFGIWGGLSERERRRLKRPRSDRPRPRVRARNRRDGVTASVGPRPRRDVPSWRARPPQSTQSGPVAR